jgi:uncharacterized OsmC-like protein
MTAHPGDGDGRDPSRPVVRRKQGAAHSDGGLRAAIDAGEFGSFTTDEPVAHGGTGQGPSPLQAVVGALCGCETVTFGRTAREMGFSYHALDFQAEFTIDIRGRQGNRQVRPHFQTVRLRAVVDTAESPRRLAEVVEETERRCPVFNLLRDAQVRLETVWVRRIDAERDDER